MKPCVVRPDAAPVDTVAAAGGALWRRGPHGVEVALVHRPRYDDWSLPKGKLDAGEHPLAAAVREVREETGARGEVSRYLGVQSYPLTVDGRRVDKRVDYWAMCWSGGDFAPHEEVDSVRWVLAAEVDRHATHAHDATVARRLLDPAPDPVVLLLVRHAKAGKKQEWDGPDRERPLDSEGRRQAAAIADVVPAFGAHRVTSAPPVRCVDTVAGVAGRLGLDVAVDDSWSEDANDHDPSIALTALDKLVGEGRSAVVCSQGAVIPVVLRDLGVHHPVARKGSAWALAFVGGTLVQADYYPTLTTRRRRSRTT